MQQLGTSGMPGRIEIARQRASYCVEFLQDAVKRLRRYLGGLRCMERKWEVTATYAPRPKTVLTYHRTWVARDIIESKHAGFEKKFLVVGHCDDIGAIEVVKRSGYFLGDLVKEFGFTVVQRYHDGEVRQ